MYRAARFRYYPAAAASGFLAAMRESRSAAVGEHDTSAVSQDYMLAAGVVHAALNTETWEFHAQAQSFVWDWVCGGAAEYTTFGRAWSQEAPYLGDTAFAAALSQLYAVNTRVRTPGSCAVHARSDTLQLTLTTLRIERTGSGTS